MNLCPLRVQLQASTSELWKLRLTGYETPASRSGRPTVLKLMLSQGGILQRHLRFWCPTCSRPLELRNEGFHERNGVVEEGGQLQPRRRGKGNAFVAVLFGPELSQKYVLGALVLGHSLKESDHGFFVEHVLEAFCDKKSPGMRKKIAENSCYCTLQRIRWINMIIIAIHFHGWNIIFCQSPQIWDPKISRRAIRNSIWCCFTRQISWTSRVRLSSRRFGNFVRFLTSRLWRNSQGEVRSGSATSSPSCRPKNWCSFMCGWVFLPNHFTSFKSLKVPN